MAGYPMELVLAEKIVTAIQRGQANTRWRDFVDVARLAAGRHVQGDRLSASIRAVAEHRVAVIAPLAEILDGFGEEAQNRWAPWRRKLLLQDSTPERFSDLLAQVVAFVDPVLDGGATGRSWDPTASSWT